MHVTSGHAGSRQPPERLQVFNEFLFFASSSKSSGLKDHAEVGAVTGCRDVAGGQRQFNGYPGRYNRAFACSALRYPPPIGCPCGQLSALRYE